MLSLSTINRWAKVDMLRPQSVAEHSFRVWVLVQDLYDQMFDVDSNSFERQSTYEWALIHDAEEVYTGDIPSDVKDLIEHIAPGVLDKLKDHVLRDKMPAVLTKQRGLKGTLPAYLVKIAEICETILYLRAYGANLAKNQEVEGFNLDKMNKLLASVSNRYRSLPWQRAYDWVHDILAPQPNPAMPYLETVPPGTTQVEQST